MAQEKNRRRAARRKAQMASDLRTSTDVERYISTSHWEVCATCYYEGAAGDCGSCNGGMVEVFD